MFSHFGAVKHPGAASGEVGGEGKKRKEEEEGKRVLADQWWKLWREVLLLWQQACVSCKYSHVFTSNCVPVQEWTCVYFSVLR